MYSCTILKLLLLLLLLCFQYQAVHQMTLQKRIHLTYLDAGSFGGHDMKSGKSACL